MKKFLLTLLLIFGSATFTVDDAYAGKAKRKKRAAKRAGKQKKRADKACKKGKARKCERLKRKAAANEYASQTGATVPSRELATGLRILNLPSATLKAVPAAIQSLRGKVSFVEPDYVQHITLSPNDPDENAPTMTSILEPDGLSQYYNLFHFSLLPSLFLSFSLPFSSLFFSFSRFSEN